MHAGMKYCLVAAAVSRRQKCCEGQDSGRVLSHLILKDTKALLVT